MSNFYALKMSAEVALHPHIIEKKVLFGLMDSVLYSPTSSKVESFSNYYGEKDGLLLKEFLLSPREELNQAICTLPELDTDEDGQYRLDLCISRDHQFLAMSLRTRDDHEVTAIRYFEGDEAKAIESHLA